MQSPPALAERQRPQIGAIEPQKVECDVDRAARVPEKIEELRAAGLVGDYHLTIEDRLVDAKLLQRRRQQSIGPGDQILTGQ